MFTVSEYDAFGPWVYEVNEDHPMPPLFVPYYKEDGNCLMVIKIPRNIERSNARPDMDLYDYVIGLYKDYIYILKRVGKNVEESRAFYSDIEGIEDYNLLLKGKLTIYLNNNKIVIPYNTVSSGIILKLIGIIRDRYTESAFDIKSDFYPDEDLNVEVLYKNMLRNIKSITPDLQIYAAQRSIPLTFSKGNIVEMAAHFLSRRELLNSLHLTNNKELIIFTRGKSFIKKGVANYAISTIYIPIEKLNSLTVESYEKYDKLVVINLKLTGKDFRFYFEQSNNRSIDFYNYINEMRLRI